MLPRALHKVASRISIVSVRALNLQEIGFRAVKVAEEEGLWPIIFEIRRASSPTETYFALVWQSGCCNTLQPLRLQFERVPSNRTTLRALVHVREGLVRYRVFCAQSMLKESCLVVFPVSNEEERLLITPHERTGTCTLSNNPDIRGHFYVHFAFNEVLEDVREVVLELQSPVRVVSLEKTTANLFCRTLALSAGEYRYRFRALFEKPVRKALELPPISVAWSLDDSYTWGTATEWFRLQVAENCASGTRIDPILLSNSHLTPCPGYVTSSEPISALQNKRTFSHTESCASRQRLTSNFSSRPGAQAVLPLSRGAATVGVDGESLPQSKRDVHPAASDHNSKDYEASHGLALLSKVGGVSIAQGETAVAGECGDICTAVNSVRGREEQGVISANSSLCTTRTGDGTRGLSDVHDMHTESDSESGRNAQMRALAAHETLERSTHVAVESHARHVDGYQLYDDNDEGDGATANQRREKQLLSAPLRAPKLRSRAFQHQRRRSEGRVSDDSESCNTYETSPYASEISIDGSHTHSVTSAASGDDDDDNDSRGGARSTRSQQSHGSASTASQRSLGRLFRRRARSSDGSGNGEARKWPRRRRKGSSTAAMAAGATRSSKSRSLSLLRGGGGGARWTRASTSDVSNHTRSPPHPPLSTTTSSARDQMRARATSSASTQQPQQEPSRRAATRDEGAWYLSTDPRRGRKRRRLISDGNGDTSRARTLNNKRDESASARAACGCARQHCVLCSATAAQSAASEAAAHDAADWVCGDCLPQLRARRRKPHSEGEDGKWRFAPRALLREGAKVMLTAAVTAAAMSVADALMSRSGATSAEHSDASSASQRGSNSERAASSR